MQTHRAGPAGYQQSDVFRHDHGRQHGVPDHVLDGVIRNSESLFLPQDKAKFILDFARRNMVALSVAQVIRLAGKLFFPQDKDGLLIEYAQTNRRALGQHGAGELARAAFFPQSRAQILNAPQRPERPRHHRPGRSVPNSLVDEVIRNSESLFSPQDKAKLILGFARRNMEALAVPQVLRLAEKLFFPQDKDGLLIEFAESNRYRLGQRALGELAAKAFFPQSKSRILMGD